MFEFAGEDTLVDEFQPAVFPFDGADFVVGDFFGGGRIHENGVYSQSREGGNPVIQYIEPSPFNSRSVPERIHLMYRIFAIVLSLFFLGFPYSQTSAENKNDQTPKTYKQTNTYQRGTDKSPLFVKVVPPDLAEQQSAQEENDKTEHRIYERWTARATVALAIVTALLAFFTFRLWTATGRLVKDAEVTAKRQLRAYVAFDNFSRNQDSMQRFYLRIYVKNYGNTPCHDMSIWITHLEREPEAGFQCATTVDKHLVVEKQMLHPGQSFNAGSPIFFNLHQRNIDQYEEWIIACGHIDYQDIFGDRWRTNFCQKCIRQVRSAGETFIPHKDHNYEEKIE